MEKSFLYKNKDRLVDLFRSEGRWLKIPDTTGRCLVLSDLHNDGRTLNFIVDKYFTNETDTIIIVCGDYGDRSPSSWIKKPTETLDYLLNLKMKYPNRLFMLMGNHDLNPKKYQKFSPCEFWNSLSKYDEGFYTEVLEFLPIISTTSNGVICTHGVLPDSKHFFDDFDINSEALKECLWSDYVESNSPIKKVSIRKQKGIDDFNRSLKSYNCRCLIKGHNPSAPLIMYDQRCITLQTTRVFKGICDRHIAIIDLNKQVDDANEVEIVNIDKMIESETTTA